MNIREKLYDYWFILLMACVFTFSITESALTYLQIGGLGIIMAVVTFAGLVIVGHVEFDLKLLFLFEAFLLVAVKDNIDYRQYDISYAWVLVLPYIMGKLVVSERDGSDKRIFYAYNVVAFAMAGICLGDIFYTYWRGSDWISLFYRFWNDDSFSRSSAEMFFTLIEGVVGYSFVHRKKNPVYFGVITFLNVLIFGMMVYHQGRFSLVAVFAGLIIFAGMYYIDNGDRQKLKKLAKGLGIFAIACFIIFLIIRINVFGIGDAYSNSFLARDGGILKNVRIEMKLAIYKALKDYPLGGYDEVSRIGSHDMWLDYGNHYGLPVLACLFCFWVLTVIDTVRLCFIKEKGFGMKYLVVPGFVLLHLNFIMEGAAFSIRQYLCYGMFIGGIARAMLGQKKNEGPVITHFEGIKYVNEES